MKNYLLVFIMFLLLFSLYPIQGQGQGEKPQSSDYQVIPDEAIRLRILANSDTDEDQKIKHTIRDQVNKEITKWVEEIADIDEARLVIQKRLDEIDQQVAATLEEEGIDQSYQVQYSDDVKFPAKVYGTYVYPAGSYEAILISLGEAKGANWWCVLFPPLCFLDFSNGTSVAEDDNEKQESNEDNDDEKEKEVKVEFFFMKWFS
ncbi:stage II sporulation protein R [Aquibacillus saliphilus]|uniref:stage II sporulation protein R n=1 Tax=Aquibacillus saliphilus TaxID=1909422 RepID=UPI001CF02143|nr:stage II sporulation protein R [Aquibacillus saliphilus]